MDIYAIYLCLRILCICDSMEKQSNASIRSILHPRWTPHTMGHYGPMALHVTPPIHRVENMLNLLLLGWGLSADRIEMFHPRVLPVLHGRRVWQGHPCTMAPTAKDRSWLAVPICIYWSKLHWILQLRFRNCTRSYSSTMLGVNMSKPGFATHRTRKVILHNSPNYSGIQLQ